MYRELVRESESEKYETERSTNISAVTVHLQEQGGLDLWEETFEQQYNYACNLVA